MNPPTSERDLLDRARRLTGRTLGQLARETGAVPPDDLRRAKGWAGTVIEAVLGATAGSRAEPDFPALGIELKSIPVDDDTFEPRESTYVCTVPLDASFGLPWEASWVRRKLACVLWVPIVGGADCPPREKRIAAPVLWRPSVDEDAGLRADWEDIRDVVGTGELRLLDARRGRVLQVRPKGADAESRTWAQDSDGEWIRTAPLGFYLRPAFTARIIARKPMF